MIPDVSWNGLAVLVSALLAVTIGTLWYSSFLFGKLWRKGSKLRLKKGEDYLAKTPKVNFALVMLGWLISGYVLAHLVVYVTATSFLEGAQTGFWIWLGFVAPFMLGSVIWEKKPWSFYLVNVGYYLISLVLQGGIVAAWR